MDLYAATVAAQIAWTKLPFFFEPAGLQEDLARIDASAWIPHFNKRDYEGNWNSLALRSRNGRVDDILPVGEPEEYRDTPLMEVCPNMRAAFESFLFATRSVRLLRLEAGARVKEHVDRCLGVADGELRVHIPVMTNDALEFVVSGRRLMLREGEAWYIDFTKPHRVFNGGATDRVHLVIDGVVNEWALAMLERSAQEIVTESYDPSAG
jgi:mannose-6-phosphate isomerase-like protein (cupin superfamily)